MEKSQMRMIGEALIRFENEHEVLFSQEEHGWAFCEVAPIVEMALKELQCATEIEELKDGKIAVRILP